MVHESEMFVHGQFVDIVSDSPEVTDENIRQLLRTVELMPPPHVRHLPVITVGNRPPSGGGSAHEGMPGGPYIRLSKKCFASRWNSGIYNYTLLHECGHMIDWAYGCMRTMRRADRAGYRALLNHPHSGRTQGPGEHYADAYADYLIGHRRMSSARRDALLNSTAFANR